MKGRRGLHYNACTKVSWKERNLKKDVVIITGSEGIVGSELSKHMGKSYDIQKLSLRFGDDNFFY